MWAKQCLFATDIDYTMLKRDQSALKQRNDYSNIYSFRILNARQQYIRVTSRHQVLKQDRNGKAWLVIGNREYVFKQFLLFPYYAKKALALLKCLQPKKPYSAERGEG